MSWKNGKIKEKKGNKKLLKIGFKNVQMWVLISIIIKGGDCMTLLAIFGDFLMIFQRGGSMPPVFNLKSPNRAYNLLFIYIL